MPLHPRLLWSAFIRVLIAILIATLVLALFLTLNPRLLSSLILSRPGIVAMPDPGPTPAPPVISAPRGEIPDGYLAFTGYYGKVSFSCGFLLQLDDGRRVGISSAHAAPAPPPGVPAEFHTPDDALAASLAGQIERGRTFRQNHFTMDYALWSVAGDVQPERFLKPDPRGQGQPGENILVFGRFDNGANGSKSWPGVIMSTTPEATWIQLEDSLYPGGFSGCPVVSQYTVRVIGMAVAGANKHPTVMGLHPIGSLVEKASRVLPAP